MSVVCPRLHVHGVASERHSGRDLAEKGPLMGHQTGGIWIPLLSTGVPLPDQWHFAASWPLSL